MELTPESQSVIYLWLMQFLLGVPSWLVLAFGVSIAAIVFHKFNSIASRIQKEPVGRGVRGLRRIIKNQFIMDLMIYTSRTLISIAILFGSSATYISLNLLRNRVSRVAENLPEDYSPLSVEPSLDFIFLCVILGIFITLSIAILSYSALRRKYEASLKQATENQARVALVARLYGNTTLAGIVIVVIGCYPLLAIVMNFIWGFTIVIPIPPSVLTIDLPGTDILLLVVLFGVLLMGIAFTLMSPTVVLASRYVAVSIRQYRENRVLHSIVNTSLAITLGLLIGLVDMMVLYEIGIALYPDIF